MNWELRIGKICPTDATFVLKAPSGAEQEALVESPAWKIFSYVWDNAGMPEEPLVALNTDNELANLFALVWTYGDFGYGGSPL